MFVIIKTFVMRKTVLLFAALLAGTAALHAQTWYPIQTGTTKKLNVIDFPSALVGYIGGNDSLLLRSMDGGQTWQEVVYSGVTFYPGGEHIVNLQFLTEFDGYMTVGPYSGTYKTTNGGVTWQPVLLPSNMCFNEGLYFFNETNGFIGGSGCFQGELIDRQYGGTWSAATLSFQTGASENRVTDIDFYNLSFGLASSAGGRLLRTTDGGQTWDSIPSPLGTTHPIHSVQILNDTLCYAAYSHDGNGFGILISEDAGLTWEVDMASATFFYPHFYDLHVAGSGLLYTGGRPGWDTTGVIFSYAAASNNWTLGSVDHPINSISSYSDSVVFAAGDNGYLVTNVQPSVIGLDEWEASSKQVQVYPNPSSDEVSVAFYPVSEHPSYRLFTTSGKLVQTGTLEKNRLNVAQLPAGTYLLQISDGEWSYRGSIVRN
jgi:photosystem II stability/assembly factor-like uncharacterized protein